MSGTDTNTKKTDGEPAEFGSVSWLRNSWVKFFEENAHKHVPSAALIPAGDPTLLFTTAGMVQFKPYFAGTEQPPAPRLATIQKCMRTTDLESVGKTDRHLTFFEMLGNFSFGDYFKEGAIQLAWDFSLQVLKLDPERIYITVYQDDDEAEKIWLEKVGVPAERISRLGKKDNWWGPAGDSGACGPCSELYWDRGEEYCEGCPPEECKPGGECDRYMEYWNLVFNQYNQDTAGNLHPLPRTGIDTGAGLERIAALLKNQDSVYDTDELGQLLKRLEELAAELGSNKEAAKYEGERRPAFRVLADHARSASFAIADGIQPDNTGRGYVIRRIIRRALMYARELGVTQPILHELVPTISEIYGDFYPEIRSNDAKIKEQILREEERFLRTLEQGLRKWTEYLANHREKHGSKDALFSGKDTFRLYDTYGFPAEMTRELAEQEGLEIDQAEYEKCMKIQQEASQSGKKWKVFTLPGDFPAEANQPTEFSGYDKHADQGRVLALIAGESSVGNLTPGEGMIVLDRTCFYAEGGGQIGDQGRIFDAKGDTLFRVTDTRKLGELYFHIGELHSGEIKLGDNLEMEIDATRRHQLMRHHSATHLLNDALRKTLGDHILQTGSLVAPEYLRFDFSHTEKLKASELESVEKIINAAIDEGANVLTEVLPIDEAKQRGAVATFGEKYGDEVRIVSMGEAGALSLEFCGGTHVSNTGDLKQFHILKESSPGAGNRRIEAVAGDSVRDFFQREFENVGGRLTEFNEKVVKFLEGKDDLSEKEQEELFLREQVPDHRAVEERLARGAGEGVGSLTKELNDIKERLERAEKSLLKMQKQRNAKNSQALMEGVDEAIAQAQSVGSIKFVRAGFQDQDAGNLRKFGDALKEKERGLVVLLGNKTEKGPMLLFMANKDAVSAGAHCGNLIKAAAGIIGGGGGGRPDMAQAGGKDAEKLDEALDHAIALLKESVGTPT